TTLAAGRSDTFVAIVDQAPAALNWDYVPELRKLLIDAAGKIRVPIVCMAAKNDATTENVKSICASAKKHGADAELIVYPPFTPEKVDPRIAPGHAIFGRGPGIEIWKKDVLAFLDKHVGAVSKVSAK